MAVTPDGIPISNRVDTTTERKLHAKVVDQSLNSTTFMARLMGNGQLFRGKTKDYTVKVINSNLGQFIAGVENLTMTASDTTVTMSFAQTAFTQPIVIPMLEAFANEGPEGTIDLTMFKTEEAQAEGVNRIGIAAYGTGANNQPLGLEGIVDDGTNNSTIGGQSRSTYTVLKATVTASSGTMSLAKLGILNDNVRAAGLGSETPTLHVTTKPVWSLYEQLIQPEVRASYDEVGYQYLPVRGKQMVRSEADLKGHAGFTALSFRGKPTIDDDNATSGTWYQLNERYVFWLGRATVPSLWRNDMEKVNLGTPKTMEGVPAGSYVGMPSPYNGWFFQKLQITPGQASAVARYWIIGQMATSQPQRNGKLTGITTV